MQEADAQRFGRALRRLDDRVRRWSPARWQQPAGRSAGPSGESRTDRAYLLAVTLAELAREAGNGAPDRSPPRLSPHAIADQLVVLAGEVAGAPGAARVLDRARAAVESAYDDLG